MLFFRYRRYKRQAPTKNPVISRVFGIGCAFEIVPEQKARTTYDNILRLVDDPDVRDPIKFLREREIVHYQRFGEALQLTTEKLDSKNFYAFNPSFDKHCNKRRASNFKTHR